MKRQSKFVCGLLIVLALWAGWSARTVLEQYDCLDAGGRWSPRGECEGAFGDLQP